MTAPLPAAAIEATPERSGPAAAPAPSRRARLAVAIVIGVLAGCYRWAATGRAASDIGPVWAAARALLAGSDPYRAVGPGAAYWHPWPLAYPMPAVLALLPLAPLSEGVASAAFAGIGSALLAFAVTRSGWARLAVFGSLSGLMAVQLAQWAPLLVGAALVPGLAVLLAAKPTVGAALFTLHPSRRAALAMVAVAVVGLALVPRWPVEWMENTRSLTHVRAPVTIWPAGPLLVLAVLRWRRPEARLLFLLACVPQTMLLYEAVPLFLVAATPIECLTLAAMTHLVWRLVGSQSEHADFGAWTAATGAGMVGLLYLPCLLMVLRRPNEGAVPAWLERAVARATPRRADPGGAA